MENQEFFDQHPIPQQISSYQFRLVGDMTLKQFFQVAGGALISIIVYSSELPAFIKWPIVLVSFILGLGLAFFPVQDRPLEKWIVAFFRSIYSPTIYKWQSTGKPYVFYSSATTQQVATPIKLQKTQNIPTPVVAPQKDSGYQGSVVSAQVDSKAGFFSKLFRKNKKTVSEVTQAGEVQTTLPRPTENTPQPTGQVAYQKYSFAQTPQPQPIQQATIPVSQASIQTTRVEAWGGQNVADNIRQAEFSQLAAPPSPPTSPNVPVGQVLDSEGKIVDNAILEIRDSDGRPARAVKTNKLGHFSIVTPLVNGNYQIITEKDGFAFEPISFNANGAIISPIIIRGVVQSTEGPNLD